MSLSDFEKVSPTSPKSPLATPNSKIKTLFIRRKSESKRYAHSSATNKNTAYLSPDLTNHRYGTNKEFTPMQHCRLKSDFTSIEDTALSPIPSPDPGSYYNQFKMNSGFHKLVNVKEEIEETSFSFDRNDRKRFITLKDSRSERSNDLLLIVIIDTNEELKYDDNDIVPNRINQIDIKQLSLGNKFKTQFYKQMVTKVANTPLKKHVRLVKDPLKPIKIKSGLNLVGINNSTILPLLSKSPKYAKSPDQEIEGIIVDNEAFNKVRIVPMRSTFIYDNI
jgi:hypothetical protein